MTSTEQQPLILIVDDTPSNLQTLGDILRERNYRIAITSGGHEALGFVHKKLPDLILLDILMPDMNGFEVCAELKKNPETQHIPVIFISVLQEQSPSWQE